MGLIGLIPITLLIHKEKRKKKAMIENHGQYALGEI